MSLAVPRPAKPSALLQISAGSKFLFSSLRNLSIVGIDVVLLTLGGVLAGGLRLALNPRDFQLAKGAGPMYALCGACWLAVMFYEQIYSPGLPEADRTDQLVKALTGGLVAAVLVSFAGHRSYAISRGVIAGWYVANLLLFVLVRPSLVSTLRRLGRSGWMLIVGDDPQGTTVLSLALERAGYSTTLVPLAADPASLAWADATAVVICPAPGTVGTELAARWECCHSQVALLPVSPLTQFGARPVNLHGVQLLAFQHPLGRGLNRACKRCIDLLGAGLLGLLIVPVAGLVALAIRLDSRGPVFYRQRRLGQAGRPFWVLKFRSMAVDADARLRHLLATDPAAAAEFSAAFKLKKDPRITRVGRFIRRVSLDEIPQLWNVLRGDMSLVGPRPIVEAEVEKYGEAYGIVASVRPGLTGVWQTSGRSDASYEARRRFDVGYVRDWSVWRDLAVLLRTIAAVVAPEAY